MLSTRYQQIPTEDMETRADTIEDAPAPAYTEVMLDEAAPSAAQGTSIGQAPAAEDPKPFNAEFVYLPPPYGDANDLPSYDEVQRMKLEEENRPPMSETPYNSVFGTAMTTSLFNSELEVGADSTFLLTFLISLMFSWVGFMLTFCVSNTLAGRYGAISGFGLSLVKWTLIMSQSEYQTSRIGDPNVGAQKIHNENWMNEWVWWLMIVMGMTIFVRGIFMYITAKKQRRAATGEDDMRPGYSLFYFN